MVIFRVLFLLKQVFQLVGVDGLLEVFVFLADGHTMPEGALHHGLVDVGSCGIPLSFCLKPPILGSLADEVEEPEN